MTDDIDLDSNTILGFFHTNLDNLSIIKEGYKIYIDKDNIIKLDEPYMFQGLWRYYNNIKRGDAIFIINKLFNNIERYFNSLYVKTCMIKNQHKIMAIPDFVINDFKLIIYKMEISKKGIENLSRTYKDDPITVKELEKIIDTINTMMTNFTKLYSTNYNV
jgi:uncharacterized protein YktB (UPF0637 family)